MKLSQLPVGALVKDPNTKYNNDVIIWQVLEHGHSGDPSGSTTLQSRDILTLKCFDAKEPNNSNNDRKQYGNNRYKYSNILQWLNSDKNSWYEAQHTADQEPSSSYVWEYNGTAINPYNSEAGFLTNFSSKLKNALLTISKTTALANIDGGTSENVESKVFMISRTEVGLGNENNIAEGSVYSLYNTASYRIKNLFNEAAKGNFPAGTAYSPWNWLLRTEDHNYIFQIRGVYDDGSLGATKPYMGNFGVAPALCISSDTEVSDTPDASNVYTLQFAPSYVKAYIGDENGLAKLIWEQEHEIENKMSILYVGDSNNTSKKPKKSYVGYNGKAVQIMYSEPKIYGVAWDGSAATSFTRLEDAKNFSAPNPYYAGMSGTPSSPFDNLYPWCEMKKSENTDAGTVVAIPKFWYKLEYASGTTGLKVFIADKPVSGFKVSPAHMNRGDGAGERDVTYVGRYHCASDYKSKTGVTSKVSTTRSAFRSGIHALGNKVWQWDYPTLSEIHLLYLTEFADWNSQAKVGMGNDSSASGSTDSMSYHTGTVASSIGMDIKGSIQYRNIEDIWGNNQTWIDGIYFNSQNIYAVINPSSFSDSSNGTLVGTRPTSNGYISAYNISSVSNFEWLLYPSAVNGSGTTYVCSYYNYSNNGTVIRGLGSESNSGGLFQLLTDAAASAKQAYINSRLMVLP